MGKLPWEWGKTTGNGGKNLGMGKILVRMGQNSWKMRENHWEWGKKNPLGMGNPPQGWGKNLRIGGKSHWKMGKTPLGMGQKTTGNEEKLGMRQNPWEWGENPWELGQKNSGMGKLELFGAGILARMGVGPPRFGIIWNKSSIPPQKFLNFKANQRWEWAEFQHFGGFCIPWSNFIKNGAFGGGFSPSFPQFLGSWEWSWFPGLIKVSVFPYLIPKFGPFWVFPSCFRGLFGISGGVSPPNLSNLG